MVRFYGFSCITQAKALSVPGKRLKDSFSILTLFDQSNFSSNKTEIVNQRIFVAVSRKTKKIEKNNSSDLKKIRNFKRETKTQLQCTSTCKLKPKWHIGISSTITAIRKPGDYKYISRYIMQTKCANLWKPMRENHYLFIAGSCCYTIDIIR